MAHDRRIMRTRLACIGAVLVAIVLAGTVGEHTAPAASQATTTLIAKAQPDECFAGIGVPYPAGPPCPAGSTPKVNGSYIWSMVEPPGAVWFGTIHNTICTAAAESSTTNPTPTQSTSHVCEYASSTYKSSCLPRFRDQRPPHIYRYDINAGTLVDKSPLSDSRLKTAIGIRFGARNNGVILFGGPDCARFGVDMFAFDETTGAYLGSTSLSYADLRRSVVVGGVLYVGVKTTTGGGAVLRWTGDKKRPFQFTQVGTLEAEVSELAEYQGRIVAGTWPNLPNYTTGNGPHAALFLSPAIPSGGLTSSNAGQWTKVWSIDNYDPDYLTASKNGIGTMREFGGYLYFGTMQQGPATTIHENVYGTDTTGFRSTGSNRPIAIFRASNLGSGNLQVQLLYGETLLWVEKPANVWTQVDNIMHATPLYGASGFGNTRNWYEWSMASFDGHLYVGTLDYRGADLWEFPDTDSAAVPITQDGFGNTTNYGIRSMSADAGGIWIGTANGSNLRTDPANPPLGGWELIRLTP